MAVGSHWPTQIIANTNEPSKQIMTASWLHTAAATISMENTHTEHSVMSQHVCIHLPVVHSTLYSQLLAITSPTRWYVYTGLLFCWSVCCRITCQSVHWVQLQRLAWAYDIDKRSAYYITRHNYIVCGKSHIKILPCNLLSENNSTSMNASPCIR